MFVLVVSIGVKAGLENAAESVFSGPFKAAISAQPGFGDVKFLRPDEGGNYILIIAFENQKFQQQWVGTGLHTKVWDLMEVNFDSFSVKTFSAV
jgi:heme-degrading monooxygenase HmoA